MYVMKADFESDGEEGIDDDERCVYKATSLCYESLINSKHKALSSMPNDRERRKGQGMISTPRQG